MGISVFPAAGGGVTQKVQEFTSTGTFTVPSNCTAVEIFLVAGGGGGGGFRTQATTAYGAGGGGGGGMVVKRNVLVTAGASITVTIGGGGAGGTGTAAGAKGTNSTFGALATAYGGGGGGSFDATNSDIYRQANATIGSVGGGSTRQSTTNNTHGGAGGGAGGDSITNFADESFWTLASSGANMANPGTVLAGGGNGSLGTDERSDLVTMVAGIAIDGYGGGGGGGYTYPTGLQQQSQNSSIGYSEGGNVANSGAQNAYNGTAGAANLGHGGGGGFVKSAGTSYNASGGAGSSGFCRVTYWS
jgi:hypothetical protein